MQDLKVKLYDFSQPLRTKEEIAAYEIFLRRRDLSGEKK